MERPCPPWIARPPWIGPLPPAATPAGLTGAAMQTGHAEWRHYVMYTIMMTSNQSCDSRKSECSHAEAKRIIPSTEVPRVFFVSQLVIVFTYCMVAE